MGLVILGSEIESNCNNLKSYGESALSAVNNMISGIENAINASELQSEAYDNLKSFLLTSYYPVCLRLKKGIASLSTGATAVLRAYQSSGIKNGELLKEDELKNMINSLESRISSLSRSLNSLGYESIQERASLMGQLSNLEASLKPLKSKLQAMYQFNTNGAGKFKDATSTLEASDRLLSSMSIPSGVDVSAYVTNMNLGKMVGNYPEIMNDIKRDIEKYGYSVWEYHTQKEYLRDLMNTGGYDLTKYQTDLMKEIEAAGFGSTAAVVAAMKYWATKYPKTDYFWGGKSNNSHNPDGSLGYNGIVTGINPDWGKPTAVSAPGSQLTPPGTIVPLGMDCSGVVAWAMQTGGKSDKANPLSLSAASAQNQADLGKNVAFGDTANGFNADKIKPGDLVSIPYDKHVGMVIDRDDTKIVCAHSSSSGGGTTIDIVDASTGKNLTHVDNPNINSNGQYFTNVTYMDEYYKKH